MLRMNPISLSTTETFAGELRSAAGPAPAIACAARGLQRNPKGVERESRRHRLTEIVATEGLRTIAKDGSRSLVRTDVIVKASY